MSQLPLVANIISNFKSIIKNVNQILPIILEIQIFTPDHIGKSNDVLNKGRID
jgi:hypothetical protein